MMLPRISSQNFNCVFIRRVRTSGFSSVKAQQFSAGYIRRRKTGISDYTIVEAKEVRGILELVQPYVRLKAEHVRLGLEILAGFPLSGDATRLFELSQLVDRFRDINY
jgi:hypothetical protein